MRTHPIRWPACAVLVLAIAAVVGEAGAAPGQSAAPAPRPPQVPSDLARAVDPVIDDLWSQFDERSALQIVEFVGQFWRLAGNPGFDASLDRVQDRLAQAGIGSADSPAGGRQPVARVSVDSYPSGGHGWDYSIGTLALVHDGRPDEIVLSRDREQLALCINSFSTPADGVTARLVDVGNGARDEDYAGKDVKGAVVIGDAGPSQLWRRAVTSRGAVGIVSTALADYVSPDPPGAATTPRDQWDILQWSSIPYDDARKGFGFKATPHAAVTLRRALAAPGGRPVNVHVTIASAFAERPARTLIVEFPGAVAPDERVVLSAHVQEPGANDNASGVATLAEMAVALARGIRSGGIPRPGRTITMLWVDEIGGSRRWLQDHADEAKRVRYMFSMDMTGEDVSKTGGTFLIERWPDPGAVWDRPWDPHTEWGGGGVRANQLKGDLINDLHLALCARVAAKSGWIVRTNPYEGGSDHTVFGQAGIPSVLDWHFTDRYYHTNLDTPDKTSPGEMRNVGVSVAASAWLLASASEAQALSVARLIADAGRARLDIEKREGGQLAAAASDPTAARTQETTILAAWSKWYGEAVHSVSRLVVGPASSGFEAQVARLAAPFESAGSAGPSAGRPTSAVATPSVPALLLAVDRLMANRWYPEPVRPDASRDEETLQAALASSNPELRRIAVTALGRFEDAAYADRIKPLVDDPDAGVRRAATAALARATPGTGRGRARQPPLPPTAPAYQVRITDLRRAAAGLAADASCAPLVDAMDDAAAMTIVRLEALRLVDPKCAEAADIASRLAALAGELARPDAGVDWHVPARALESLARFDAAQAEPLVRAAMNHPVWQVRAAAARAAGTLRRESELAHLAADRAPNVRTAALDELARLKSPLTARLAIDALSSDDYQLVYTAATALKGAADAGTATPALLAALKRLTAEGKDTSRDPRLAILQSLNADDLTACLRDFDPKVADAAADAIRGLTGTRPDPQPTFRPPVQPAEDELRNLPRRATLVMANGDEVVLELLADEAPMTVARFAALARRGYYDHLTFHRIVPLFVVQGGSPGANEYTGDARFWRDEIGASNTRGAVGLSTRGRDTGDGQIFIDLVDLPRLDGDYTVFARVVEPASPAASGHRTGMAAVDAMLEGAEIAQVRIGSR